MNMAGSWLTRVQGPLAATLYSLNGLPAAKLQAQDPEKGNPDKVVRR
jgi:hypothetical protein